MPEHVERPLITREVFDSIEAKATRSPGVGLLVGFVRDWATMVIATVHRERVSRWHIQAPITEAEARTYLADFPAPDSMKRYLVIVLPEAGTAPPTVN